MGTTKTNRKQRIGLPADLIEILRWHVETQLIIPEQRESELLFPSITGGYRSPTVLVKPFAAVAEAIDLKKRFSARGLRRTFNDLARHARIEGVITKSISGHVTESHARALFDRSHRRAAREHRPGPGHRVPP